MFCKMSVGYGATAVLAVQDDKTIIYKYAPYNLNLSEFRNGEATFDGLITICTEAMIEPEIHEKLKRTPGKRKRLVVKRIRREVDYFELLRSGKIMVESSQYCWESIGTDQNIGKMAMLIIYHIFNYYQDNGALSARVSLNY